MVHSQMALKLGFASTIFHKIGLAVPLNESVYAKYGPVFYHFQAKNFFVFSL
jgi:hypothetical protein